MDELVKYTLKKAIEDYEIDNEYRFKIINECIKHGVEIEHEYLLTAINNDNYWLVKFLIKLGIDVKMNNNAAILNLFDHYSVNDKILKLLVKHGADVCSNDNYCLTSVCNKSRDITLVQYLLSQGAKFNNNAIYRVFHCLNFNLQELALKNGVDPNTLCDGRSILEIAMINTDKRRCQLLIAYGANILLFDKNRVFSVWKSILYPTDFTTGP